MCDESQAKIPIPYPLFPSPYSLIPIPFPQHQTPIFSALQAWVDKSHAPFYTPGHKRGAGMNPLLTTSWGASVFGWDLPELPGLDNLACPTEVIQTAQELAAAAFGAEQTWFLVNGSTAGVIAAILATCGEGDRKSVV